MNPDVLRSKVTDGVAVITLGSAKRIYFDAEMGDVLTEALEDLRGGFNRSAQHLLILRGEEVCDGDVADLVHGSAESRAVGAMEEWAKCCGDLAGAGKEEQDGR